ncbi:MAG TPA: hypothetical protein VE994_21635 [Terriglobales bacterium]|nr:hypothetical protein [Terriglobales bacterium]
MKRAVFACVIACGASVPVIAQSTFNAFDCSRYGDYSTCHVPDGTEIRCHNGSYSECTVTHPNGQTGVGPGSALIAWLVERHREHKTDKAIENATATVTLTVKYSILLSDAGTLVQRLGPYLPPNEKTLAEQLTKYLASQSSVFSGAVSGFAASWSGADRASFYHAAKGLQKLYNSGLVPVCSARAASRMLTDKLDAARGNLPADIAQALDSVKSDQTLLEPECTSKDAVKLLKKQAEKMKEKPR